MKNRSRTFTLKISCRDFKESFFFPVSPSDREILKELVRDGFDLDLKADEASQSAIINLFRKGDLTRLLRKKHQEALRTIYIS